MPLSSSYHSYVSSPRRYNSALAGPLTIPTTRLLIMGLPNSGKSTLFQFIIDELRRRREYNNTQPRIDMETETVVMGKDIIETVDLHMGEVLADRRNVADSSTFREASGVIFLIDFGQDGERWGEVHRQLRALDGLLREDVPIVVLVIKADHIWPVRAPFLSWNRLELGEIEARGRRPIGLFLSSLVIGIGFQEGLHWLARKVSDDLN